MRWALASCFLLFCSSLAAQETRQTVQVLPAAVATKTDNLNNRYWLYLPARYHEAKEPLPLIIYLHGSSRRGRNINEVKANGLPPLLDKRDDFDFVVASPQALSKYPWQRCWQPDDLVLLLDHLLATHRIDRDRVYLTGLSMGGYGTWAGIAKHADRFAAAAPICGGGDPAWAKEIGSLPVWAFHGDADAVVPIRRSREMVDAIQSAGGNAQLTSYPGVGHDSFTQTYANPALYKWLLAQTRAPASISIAEIKGRNWLVDQKGKPFFAHGITHTGNTTHAPERIAKACKELGFNAFGYGCSPPLRKEMPYLEGQNNLVPMSTYRSDGSFHYVDVFDAEVQAKMTRQIQLMCQRNHENPNLIGYCWTDLGAWPLENSTGTNWVDFIRSLPANATGKQVYSTFEKEWKGDVSKRDQAFLVRIAREYFQVLGEANRKYDPHHLIFGDRFAFNTFEPDVVKEMLPYVDAIAIQPPYQPTFPKAKYDEIYELTGKPILLCDFAIRFKDGDKAVRGWKPQASAKLAGEAYTNYLREAMKTPYILGAFWCNLADSKPGFKKNGIKQGFFDERLNPRPGLSEAVRAFNLERDRRVPTR